MRKITLFPIAVAVVLILAGVGTWATSPTSTRLATSAEAGFDPTQMMMNAKDLSTAHIVHYSVVFN